ncbi:hypothetical protein KDW40_01845 [Burkholderia cenocepacia]|uniref:hypothetical protein n=1 Tax=Burkholderia cenocepacia TaxID=95486 RepID=UPI001B9BCCE4|nr:hypothetical protein [Burkholderia cenocepacia]MBR8043158.1 hypothetical protein [Burkholderia cenocepacia]MBR8324472.1 hypothetical protein [Burkholderia cenocepacia]
MIEVLRSFAGVQIRGESIAISIHPVSEWRQPGDPTISLSIDGRSREWGNDWARLTSEQRLDFTPDELEIVQTSGSTGELRALHVEHAGLPGFRSGVTVALEHGMHAFLETELPRVDRVTRLTATLRDAVEPHLGRSPEPYAWTTLHPHELVALLNVASGAVIAGHTSADALRYAVLLYDGRWALSEEGDDPQYAGLGAALRQPDVLALLAGHAS